jgi:aspartate-semialdehyde dehydrogenase
MKVAVVGATGLVGTVMLKILEERSFPVSTLIPAATERSVGREIRFRGNSVRVVSVQDAVNSKPDLALFSAGGSTSLEWAPRFAEAGCTVIDNSSAWRMDPGKKLVVPEINGGVLSAGDRIIANPNCSTIQMVMALAPLHRAYKIKRIVVSTYQSVTGTGAKALNQLEAETEGRDHERVYAHPIHRNVIPQCDLFTDNGYTKEEMKMVNETRKILGDDSIRVTATAVRVPVKGGHSESVNVEFERDYSLSEVSALLRKTNGLVLLDGGSEPPYPTPLYAEGRDEVFVGRLRRDESQPCSLNLWIVADNLRKGAATNAVQIAELLHRQGLLPG